MDQQIADHEAETIIGMQCQIAELLREIDDLNRIIDRLNAKLAAVRAERDEYAIVTWGKS